MSLETDIMGHMKEAMKEKNEAKLRALRAIKAEIIKAKVEPGANGVITPEAEIKLLSKMAKERREAEELYTNQNREDLAKKEKEEIEVIELFLPAQLSAEELKAEIEKIIAESGASSIADMGKVMGAANKALAGRADGKAISALVKELLAK